MDGWMLQIYRNVTRENNVPVSVKQAQSPALEHFSHHHYTDIWDRYLHLTMETGVHFALTVMVLLVRSRCWGDIRLQYFKSVHNNEPPDCGGDAYLAQGLR